MAGDHACPVCAARFTRPQHVTRHMRSHTGDRPYKCNQCGDQFARSDLLSRHVNKCHSGQGGPTTTGRRKNAANSAAANVTLSSVPPVDGPCDQCLLTQQRCDAGNPCGQCIFSKSKCSHSKAPKPRRASAGGPINRRTQQDLLFANPSSLPIQDQYLHQPTSTVGPPQPYDLNSNQFGLGMERGSALPPMSMSGLPLPINNSQFMRNEPSSMYPQDQSMGITASLNQSLDLGLPGFSSVPTQQSAFGIGAPGSTLNGSQVFNDGGQYHYRRSSLGVPGQTNGYYGAGNLPSLSSSFATNPLQQQPPYPRDVAEVQGGAYGQQVGYGSPRPSSGAGMYEGFGDRSRRFDDASSNSDYGSSAPSPVMSYASSSRPTSSSGPPPSIGSQPASEQFISSLSGAVPLPTPMQLQTFNAFANGPAFNQTAGVQPVENGGKPAVGTVGIEGSPYLPYQSFDNLTLEDQHRAFAAAAANVHARNNGSSSANAPVLSAGGREATINELKEFWSAFICEPTTGGNSNGTNSGHTLTKQMSMPSLKTPMALDRNYGNFMEIGQPTPRALYPSHQSILGIGKDGKHTSSTVGGGVGNTPIPQSNDRSTSDTKDKDNIGSVVGARNSTENLRSYQEACLKRETPMLRLAPGHRPKSRTVNSTSPPQINVQLQPMAPQQPALAQSLPPVSSLVNGDGLTPTPSRPDPTATGDDKPAGAGGRFAAPFAPGTQEARDWHQYSNVTPIPGSNPTSANNYSISRFATVSNTNRPSYKRLPSTTLGPENSKITKTNSMRFPGDNDVDEMDHADSGGRGALVSYPQPGYHGAAAGPGGAHGAWMRQRSMSSPTSLRSFEWQSLDAGAR